MSCIHIVMKSNLYYQRANPRHRGLSLFFDRYTSLRSDDRDRFVLSLIGALLIRHSRSHVGYDGVLLAANQSA